MKKINDGIDFLNLIYKDLKEEVSNESNNLPLHDKTKNI